MKRKFKVLYTHQKMKKKKTWQDGVLTLSCEGARGFLTDESSKQISTVYLNNKKIECGVELESDKYLVQVEEEMADSNTSGLKSSTTHQPPVKDIPICTSSLDLSPTKPIFKKSITTKSRKSFTIPRKTAAVPCNKQSDEVVNVTIESKRPSAQSIWCTIEPLQKYQFSPERSPSRHKQHIPNDIENRYVDVEPEVRGARDVLDLLGCVETTESLPRTNDMDTSACCDVVPPAISVVNSIAEDVGKVSSKFGIQHFDLDFDGRDMSNRTVVPEQFTNASKLQLRCRLQKCVSRGNDSEICKKKSTGYKSAENMSPDNDERKQRVEEDFQMRMSKEIFFPSYTDIHSFTNPPQHFMPPPAVFSSLEEYSSFWTSILKKRINVNLWKMCCSYHRALERVTLGSSAMDETLRYAPTKNLPEAPATNQRINNARGLTTYLCRNGLNLFTSCKLTKKSNKSAIHEDDVLFSKECEEVPFVAANQLLLQLSRDDRCVSSAKDSIWVITRTLHFADESTFVAKAVSNVAPSSLEVAIQPLCKLPVDWFTAGAVHALFVQNATMEFACFQTLHRFLPAWHLLPCLLKPRARVNVTKSSTHQPLLDDEQHDAMMKLVCKFTEKYQLDENQCSVLCSFAEMLKEKENPVQPFLIIDGAVGSGKSFLVALMVKLLFDVFKQETDENDVARNNSSVVKWKVLLVSENDDVVDSLVHQVLQVGCESVVRFGNLKNVSRELLPIAAHSVGGADQQSKTLKEMLRRCGKCHPDRSYIERSLQRVESGASKRQLHDSFVVAATCQALLSPSVRRCKFRVAMMDGCDATSEVVALSSFARFRCEKLIVTGDSAASSRPHSPQLGSSLFNRLLMSGHDASVLTSNYRCHPQVTEMLSEVFYSTQLRSGVACDARPRLVEWLPSLCFYDVSGSEEKRSPGEFSNPIEAQFVADMVKVLIGRGLPGTSILIIAPTHAQVDLVTSSLQDIEFYDMSDVNCVHVTTASKCGAMEKQVVIVSCVGTTAMDNDLFCHHRSVLTLLSRARNHLFVVGNVRNMSRDNQWKAVIEVSKSKRSSVVQSSFAFKNLCSKKAVSTDVNDLRSEVPVCVVASPTSSNQEKSCDPDHDSTSEDSLASVSDNVEAERAAVNFVTTSDDSQSQTLEQTSQRKRKTAAIMSDDET